MSNSLSDAISKDDRSLLKGSFGFNQKSIDFLLNPFYVVASDYLNIYNVLEWKIEEHSKQIPYGLVLEEFSSFKVRSLNTYHKIKVKINVIKIMDDDISMADLYIKCFNKDCSAQDVGRIPSVYQIVGRVGRTSSKYFLNMLCYNRVSLNQSSNFKTQAKIVKTYSKTLNPGDTLDFRMTHHYKSGIRIDVLQSYVLDKSENLGHGHQPSGYGLVIEYIGIECQGMRNEDKLMFQGTCPGWYTYEYNKSVKLIRNSSIISSSSELDSITDKYAIRVFSRDYLANPPISFAADDIGMPGESGKAFSVISTSDEQVVYSSNIGSSSKVTEIDEEFDKISTEELLDG